jgi:hypothetical protein
MSPGLYLLADESWGSGQADRLYKLAKASLTKVENGYYAGCEALERRNAGVAFEGLDIKIGSIKG